MSIGGYFKKMFDTNCCPIKFNSLENKTSNFFMNVKILPNLQQKNVNGTFTYAGQLFWFQKCSPHIVLQKVCVTKPASFCLRY